MIPRVAVVTGGNKGIGYSIVKLLLKKLGLEPSFHQLDSDSMDINSMDNSLDMARVAVVTGGNKGIGYSIVKLLLQSKSQDVVYLTARDEGKGKEAVASLKKLGLEPSFHQLDIDSAVSISSFANYLKKKYGGLDVLINNAGIAYKVASTAPFDEQAEVTNKTNFFGTLNVCEALIPLLRYGARVVHVSSQSGHNAYSRMQPQLQKQFISHSLTKDQLSDLINSFISATKQNSHKEKGWPSSAYGVSKTGVTALCAVQQRDYEAAHPGRDVIFSACCPGYCDTDMTSHKGPRHADVGADVAVFLATLSSDSQKGKFWYDRKVIPWGPWRQ